MAVAIGMCFGVAGQHRIPRDAGPTAMTPWCDGFHLAIWRETRISSSAVSLFRPAMSYSRERSLINGRRVGTLRQLDLASGPTNLSLPIGAHPGEREINVHIHVDNPRSPREAGLSSDDRRLGLFVQSIRIKHAAPPLSIARTIRWVQ